MIRLAFLLPHLRPGGAERVVLHWIQALDRSRFAPVLMLGRVEGSLLAELPADVPVVPIGGTRALTRPWRIARALAEHRIDLAYSATSAMNLATLAAPTRVPRIVSEHTPPDAFAVEAKWPAVRRAATALLRRRAVAVAAPTALIADTIDHPRSVVIRNPVLSAPPPPLSARDPAGTHLVAAGRLVPAKGFDLLIDAAALLAGRDVGFTLAIHGDGPERDALAARIAAHGIERQVTLAGHTADLRCVLAGADLVVSSSRREGFGNVLVEAMGLGTPVLATRAGGPESFIEHDRTGFLVEPHGPAALADAIGDLLADPTRRLSVRNAARKTAAHFTIAASVAEFAALAETCVGRAVRLNPKLTARAA